MRKRGALITVVVGLASVSMAADSVNTAWEKSIVGGLNMTQTGFDNWSAGGENAFAWQMNLNFKFTRDQEKTNWSNSGKVVYGATKIGDGDMRKSVDEVKVESVLTYKLGSKINPYAALNGETQVEAGYDYSTIPETQISALMDPGYFRESFGAGFDIKDGVSTRLGLSLKQTVTTDYPQPYADDVETLDVIETTRSEVGLESVSDFSIPVSKTSLFTSKLELFSALKAADETDVNWDNTLSVKVSEYINVNVNVKLVYDKDISVKRQLKQSMALGVNYTFI